MRHGKLKSDLNRFTSWRKATLISTARNLLLQQSIKTSLRRAKATRRLVERLISLAKANTLSAKRRAFKVLGDHRLVAMLFKEIGPRFSKRQGGYTRIVFLGRRRGDNAQVVLFELTEIKKKEVRKPSKHKESKTEEETGKGIVRETPAEQKTEQKKRETGVAVQEKPPITKKPSKKFLGGLKNIFKKERDSL